MLIENISKGSGPDGVVSVEVAEHSPPDNHGLVFRTAGGVAGSILVGSAWRAQRCYAGLHCLLLICGDAGINPFIPDTRYSGH